MSHNQNIRQQLNIIFDKSLDIEVNQYILSRMDQFKLLIAFLGGSKETILFRGQEKSKWKLTSTWLRTKTDVPSDYEYYRANIFIFNQYMEIIQAKKENKDLGLYKILTDLQHARAVPTPLIEFTNHILLALYYATRVNNYQEDAALFILIENDKVHESFKELDHNTITKVYKNENNLQHKARQSLRFVFDFKDWESDENVYKIVIKKSIIKKIQNCLREINHVYKLIDADLKSDYLEAINSPSHYYFLEGYKKFRKEDMKNAIKDFEKSLSLEPNNVDSLIFNGNAKLLLKKYQAAIKIYDRVLKIIPNDARIYYNRGVAKGKGLKSKAALVDFDKAIALGFEDFYIYASRARTRYRAEKFKDSIEDFTKALEYRPDDASLYFDRGKSKFKLKDYENAFADYSQAITLDPENVLYYSKIGGYYFYLKNYEAAIKYFDKVVALETKRGKWLFKNEKYLNEEEGMVLSLVKLGKIHFPSSYALTGRALAKFEFQDYEGAIADFNEVLKIEPKYGEMYAHRGLAHYYLKNYEKTLEDLNLSKKNDPKFLKDFIADRKLDKIFSIDDFGVTFNKNN